MGTSQLFNTGEFYKGYDYYQIWSKCVTCEIYFIPQRTLIDFKWEEGTIRECAFENGIR